MESPTISIVVPTHDRHERLSRLLRGLEAQTFPADDFEVVVVDDGSLPPVRVSAESGLRLRLLRNASSSGPAAARNIGWRAATGALVAFTDDDCRPSVDWLRCLFEKWQGDTTRIVQGATAPDPEGGSEPGPLTRTMDIRGPTGVYETCNIAYPRVLLERTQGFDERFKRACGEDLDLGMRARNHGAELSFAPHALVYHAVHQPSLASMIRHARIWSDAALSLKLHPELRSLLVARAFFRRTHPLLLMAAAGMALSTRGGWWRTALSSALPYCEHYRRAYSDVGESWIAAAYRLPVHALVDLVEVGTMLEGTVRHRVLML